MSISNRDRVGRALEILNVGLRPFVERELEATYGQRWRYEAVTSLQDHHISDDGKELRLDIAALLRVMWDQWHQVFKKTLGHTERNYVSELREARNKWAHQEPFSTEAAYRTLDTVQLLLHAISDGERAEEVQRQKLELQRISYEEQTRTVTRRNTGPLTAGQPLRGLLPWREVVTPHKDVSSGNYAVAEFAADLSQVYHGIGASAYSDPRDFFSRTFLTYGLRQLLLGALRRLSGNGGNPIIELQTNFGGGKTHSLLALYHLFSGVSQSELIGIDSLLTEVDLREPPKAKRAVLVGYDLSPAELRKKGDGCVVHTLWGELAWQLLGREGYEMVAEADQQGISPSAETLRVLFGVCGPTLILIDEWIVFVRQLYTKSHLPAGTFDANITFAQVLTEAAKASPQTLVVASLPSSENESGGEGGQEAMARLKQIFGRLESPWRPADRDEGFEIVRRRLFEPIPTSTLYTERDAVARAFSQFYREQRKEFPDECGEVGYEQRIKSGYPIHPELFDRLFTDWSSIEKFQRTRGVLRLMAAIIHELWVQQDRSLLIMPSNLPLATNFVQSVFTDYLTDNWVPIIAKDVDGNQALPQRIDNDHPNLGRYSATKRVARTIFFGSAPTHNSGNKGIQDQNIKLGCAQPGESVATFGDALRRLTTQATFLYESEHRYWYDTQQNVTRVALDRASQYDDETVCEALKKELKVEQESKGDFSRVHICPESGMDIADEDTSVRLVLLRPQVAHARRDLDSPALAEARKMLAQRGNTPRSYSNTVIFLAADRPRLDELKQALRLSLAWESIEPDNEQLNLDAFSRNQVRKRTKEAKERVAGLIPETYVWLLVPEQPNPREKADRFGEYKLAQKERGLLATYASSLLRTEELLITQLSGTRLRLELDRIPLWRGNHVSIKELTEYFAKYIYLLRLKNKTVLLEAIRDGVQAAQWQKETFAYAAGWSETQQRYQQLAAGTTAHIVVDGQSLLVKPTAAAKQFEAEAREREEQEARRRAALAQVQAVATQQEYVELSTTHAPQIGERSPGLTPLSLEVEQTSPMPPYQEPLVDREKQVQRFYGSVKINERRMGSEAGRVMDEIVKHLTSLSGASVKITLEIEGQIPSGIPDVIVRTIKENGKTLQFETCEFEES